jgi:hypothetical protein
MLCHVIRKTCQKISDRSQLLVRVAGDGFSVGLLDTPDQRPRCFRPLLADLDQHAAPVLWIGLPRDESGPFGYTDVSDIPASLKEMTEAGAEIVQDARDVGNGLLIAQVKDSGGNILGLGQRP